MPSCISASIVTLRVRINPHGHSDMQQCLVHGSMSRPTICAAMTDSPLTARRA